MNSPTPYEPPSAPARPPPDPSRGSLLVGFLLGWAMLIGGYSVVGVIAAAASQIAGSSGDLLGILYLFGGSLPWVGMLALIVWFAVKNKPRSAVGVALAIASMVGLAILLVAACFGLLASSGGWH